MVFEMSASIDGFVHRDIPWGGWAEEQQQKWVSGGTYALRSKRYLGFCESGEGQVEVIRGKVEKCKCVLRMSLAFEVNKGYL